MYSTSTQTRWPVPCFLFYRSGSSCLQRFGKQVTFESFTSFCALLLLRLGNNVALSVGSSFGDSLFQDGIQNVVCNLFLFSTLHTTIYGDPFLNAVSISSINFQVKGLLSLAHALRCLNPHWRVGQIFFYQNLWVLENHDCCSVWISFVSIECISSVDVMSVCFADWSSFVRCIILSSDLGIDLCSKSEFRSMTITSSFLSCNFPFRCYWPLTLSLLLSVWRRALRTLILGSTRATACTPVILRCQILEIEQKKKTYITDNCYNVYI